MAGHSKWANIRHRKGKADAVKGKIFTRVAKEIITAVKLGGPDPKNNPRLRVALQKGKEGNVPNDVIERNIKKGMSQDTANYEDIVYELYGHGGVGIIVEVMTDNRNRISSDMRIATNKRGGTVATPGAVSFNFDRKGIIELPKSAGDEDALFSLAIDSGAEDFEATDDGYFITTHPHEIDQVKETLRSKGIPISDAAVSMIPKTTIACSQEDQKSNLALIEWIEGIDDVDELYHNMEMCE
jgi:YebC/PmpR family DNA-binding regulatory protein